MRMCVRVNDVFIESRNEQHNNKKNDEKTDRALSSCACVRARDVV